MIHSVMPIDVIFPPQDTSSIALKEMPVEGVNVLVEQLPNGRNRIERIISSNPMDFLNPRLQPGAII